MEKNIKIKIPEGYNDAVFDKETNEIKFIKGFKLGDKVTIDGVEGYVLEVDDAGEPTVLCSEVLGSITWEDAMKKANQGLWHLPTVEEFKKYYNAVLKLDRYIWGLYWTSTKYNSLNAHSVNTSNGAVGNFYAKTTFLYVRAFAFVGSKKDSKPRSWKEYCEQVKNTSCFAIDIASMGGAVTKRSREKIPFANEVNTIEEAEAIIALCKLIQLRDAWCGEWKPDWDSANDKFVISSESNKICKSVLYYSNRCLAFPTPEMRDEFLESFRDLIEEAKPLL